VNRRSFLAAIGLGAAAVPVGISASGPTTLEYIEVGKTPGDICARTRVWLDGEEVPGRDCFMAEATKRFTDGRTRMGRVRCYKRLPDGSAYLWGSKHDPDPATNCSAWHDQFKRYKYVDGKAVWNRPYPGFGEIAWEEFSGDVRIELR
jgi:hypothetical protein